ncbi:MAG: acyl-CoA/acyl-ACP dehydrogenase [Gammaproteobacteria bacterium]|jgi:acyl-CoA dehydrogenase|nr:acyl-CoA/acyl-ACP dehydrogenase [Gammaproteobacteria bacterium]
MDFNFTEEHQMLLDTADKIARDFPRSYYVECAKTQTFPQAQWDALASAGILGINTPEAYGGSGLGMVALVLLQERLAERGVAPLFFVVNQGIAVPSISRHGTEAQKQRWLPAIASGEKRCCFAITEPNAGTNTFKIQTVAKEEGDHFILNGNKLFISGINDAHQVLVVAKTSTGEGRAELTLFVVDTDSAGLSWDRMDTMLLNAEGQFFVYFDNVKVPRENVLGKVGRGIEVLFDALNPERMVVAAGAIGGGRHALARGVEYANERTIFKGPIGAYQGLQHPMAEARAQLEAASLLVLKSAWLHDQGQPPKVVGDIANMGKLVGTDAAYKAADAALQCFGGYGFCESYDMLSHFIAARLGKVAPINREMTLNYIGEFILGLPKSY